MTRTQILHALDAFLESRPGFDPANYQGAPQAYRADYRRAYQHLQDGRALLRAVSWRDGIDADTLARVKHHRIDFVTTRSHECACGHKWTAKVRRGETPNLSGEVTQWCPKCNSRPSMSSPHSVRVDYCTGQYYPVEFRAAVCHTLSSALWDYFRERCGCQTADAIRTMARRELGRSIARRWFGA